MKKKNLTHWINFSALTLCIFTPRDMKRFVHISTMYTYIAIKK